MQGATCQTGKLRDASYRVVPDKRAAPVRPRRARRSRIVSVSVIHDNIAHRAHIPVLPSIISGAPGGTVDAKPSAAFVRGAVLVTGDRRFAAT